MVQQSKTKSKILKAVSVPLIGLFLLLSVANIAPVLNLPFGATAACAQSVPNLGVIYTVAASSESAFTKTSNPRPGDTVGFAIEVHNTIEGSTAENLFLQATFPTNGGGSTVTVSSTTAGSNSASDSVTVNLPAGTTLSYIPGSTRLTWDRDGDGVKEFNSSPLGDGIVGDTGVNLGNMHGCNAFIAQLLFTAQVSQSQVTPTPTPTTTPGPTVTPTPTSVPAPTATPTPGQVGGQTQTQTQTQNNTQTQTVNQNVTVNQPAAVVQPQPVVLAAKAPAVQPKTGAETMVLTGLFGSMPLGFLLRRRKLIA